MEFFIYALKHPDTLEVNYIGCTTAKLGLRFSQHIWDAKNKTSKKSKWIKDLLDLDKKPVLELLDICDENTWQQAEISYILKYSNLTNKTKGGDCIVLNRTREAIQRSTEFRFKKVDQFEINGKFIKTWDSIKEAAKHYNIVNSSIGNAIIGLSKSSAGFKWKHH